VARFLDRFQPRIGVLMETEVWPEMSAACAERDQPVRIGLGLRPHRSQRRVSRPRKPAQALGRGQRVFVEARVGQHQRNTALGASGRHLGPDLGFHQHADARLEAVEKARHRLWRIPWLPDLEIAFFQQLGALFAPRGRAVGDQDRDARVLAPQLGDQDAGRARFAERNRMDPAPAGAGCGLVIVAEALLDRMRSATARRRSLRRTRGSAREVKTP
jgi:hypothetical protein